MPTQVRHKPPTSLERPRELIVACAPLRSNVNLSRIVRMAGCCGLGTVIACGQARVLDKIARDALVDDDGGDDAAGVDVRVHRTLVPVLRALKQDGYPLVALEQADRSESLHTFAFPRRAVLVVGNERHGLDDEILQICDHVVEIPVYGRPLAYNAATAACLAMYEYCRQFPRG